MKTPYRIASLPLAALALLFLSACGNKGPLVMPQKPVPVEEQQVEPVDGDTTPVEDTPPPVQDAKKQEGDGNG